MSLKSSSEKEIFRNVIDIGLRMYGNGQSYSESIVTSIHDYCRTQISHYLVEYQRLMKTSENPQLSLLTSMIYLSRHKKARLKRLQQFLQAKERREQQFEDEQQTVQPIVKQKKIPLSHRFQRICRQIDLRLDISHRPALDRQRSRQYSRLDAFYKSDSLTTKDYLEFVEQQNSSFNQLRLLSPIDILQWLQLSNFSFALNSSSNRDLRLAELCLFLLKEILLDLMDDVFRSKVPCSLSDVLRRRYVRHHRRLPYSRR